MPVVIREDAEKSTIWQPVTISGRYTVPRGIVRRQVRGERINDLPGLWPFDEFRRITLKMARLFTTDQAKRGKELITPEADVRVYGPYKPAAVKLATGADFGMGESNLDDPFRGLDFADFKLVGVFVAKYGKIPKRRCLTCREEVDPRLTECPHCGAPLNRDFEVAKALALADFDPHKI